MAKPNQPKDIKPKAEGDEKQKGKITIDENTKFIIVNLVSTILICALFVSINYLLQSNLLTAKFNSLQKTEETATDDSADSDEEVQHGIIVDLGDFILNLNDISPRKYLKVNVALEVSTKPEDATTEAPAGKEGAAAASPVETEMVQFKPAIRDAVITTLSSKSSAELSTTAGKELAKEQITEAVNGIFAGDREVIRVSFGQFIIQ